MINHKNLLIVGGVLTASGCLASVYFTLHRKKQDRLAADLIKEITWRFNPSSAGLLSENALDIHYKDEVLGKAGKPVLVLKNEVAAAYAEKVHSAWGSWWNGGDNEDQVYSVFRSLKDKVQVSQVAEAYQVNYGTNLIDRLNDKLDDEEIKTVLSIIKPLPAFRTKT